MSRGFSVSARRLGFTLWEINGVNTASSHNSSRGNEDDHSPVSQEGMERRRVGSVHRRRASTGSQKLVHSQHHHDDFPVCLNQNINMQETSNHGRSSHSQTRHGLKEVRRGLTTSKELLKLLTRFWGMADQQSTCLSLISALKTELDQVSAQVTKAIQGEVDSLLKRLEEERAKERRRVHSAMESLVGELRSEKRMRRQTERLNKNLGRELASAKASLSEAAKEAESERRAREILEQVCDELGRGIGEDRAEVEALKREAAKVREEVDKEREMLQLADVLREERVQMKLSEAKFEFEEKNAVVEELKSELESYLRFKKGGRGGEVEEESPSYERIKALEKHLRETLPSNGAKIKTHNDDNDEDDDSGGGDSDLHSIELCVDENSKSYEWASNNNNNSNSIGRSKKHCPIYLERQTSEGIVLEFAAGVARKEENDKCANGFSPHSLHGSWKRECEVELERYNMIKDLRDHIVSSSSKTTSSSQDLIISPAKKWSHQSFNSQDFTAMVGDSNSFSVAGNK
ncbi:unnamed protein product [Cuscuta campestris]|uniref:Uncharacterized protein n=1 Tax=Cuscuta campestris TaxID=132261 RepID=A0A484ND24_9ASTE|nr:unnamed protein product [Cuscuta campestris]